MCGFQAARCRENRSKTSNIVSICPAFLKSHEVSIIEALVQMASCPYVQISSSFITGFKFFFFFFNLIPLVHSSLVGNDLCHMSPIVCQYKSIVIIVPELPVRSVFHLCGWDIDCGKLG